MVTHRVVTHRVLTYRVLAHVEWSHIEWSHRVVTHTLHFVFYYTVCYYTVWGLLPGYFFLKRCYVGFRESIRNENIQRSFLTTKVTNFFQNAPDSPGLEFPAT